MFAYALPPSSRNPPPPPSMDSRRGLIVCRLLAYAVNEMTVFANLNFHLPVELIFLSWRDHWGPP